METCLSPRKVFVTAWKLGLRCLPEYSSFHSRKDFTLPQLFACLVLKVYMKQSYRKAAVFLKDVPDWLAEIDMEKAPHHRTINDAFDTFTRMGVLQRLLSELAQCFQEAGHLKLDEKPLAVDSTYFESHHVSRHYEKRKEAARRKEAKKQAGKQARKKATQQEVAPGTQHAPVPDDQGRLPDAQGSYTRSETVSKLPKLVLAVAAACHVVLALAASTGMGGDQNCLHDVLVDAWTRADVRTAVADAGFDSEENHRLARLDLGVHALIPPDSGRPTDKAPPTEYRAEMRRTFDLKLYAEAYGQRWQCETVNSMIKRNYGSALSARSANRREREMALRAIVHNIALPPQCELL